jgi:hypothetical protein
LRFLETECNSVDVQLSPNDKPIPFKITKPEQKVEIELKQSEKRVILNLKAADQKWINLNKDTCISYSCSEGLKKIIIFIIIQNNLFIIRLSIIL